MSTTDKLTKVCTCCGSHVTLNRDTAQVNEIGYWQDCSCGTTMLWIRDSSPFDEARLKMERKRRLMAERKANNDKIVASLRRGKKK